MATQVCAYFVASFNIFLIQDASSSRRVSEQAAHPDRSNLELRVGHPNQLRAPNIPS
jgi:hypothetical protein